MERTRTPGDHLQSTIVGAPRADTPWIALLKSAL
jgi:hypothetical protein